ncbi:LiaI-LiaF-like domain-containing protein [Thalassobacillus pellis]|uniref:LiaI-LiaF-like domain-containing protein n=1 Tax=Thalassobacillus pellis TaxID=748008 RepID=UPI001961E347|nr:DUF5668 domain-containing protein [Thalassobacillus pellis]MBM7554600.1 membrane-bound ClpP family serine protease [Thalassobacillus pellis]
MKKQNTFVGFFLIGIGAYFLLQQFHIPLFTDFYSWPTILMIIGLSLLLHSYISNDYQSIFTGALLLGLGLHFHGIRTYSFWIDHWGIYLLIVGIALLLQYNKTKKGLLPGLLLVGLAIFAIVTTGIPSWFYWLNQAFNIIERFWPVVLIVIGIYMLMKRK